MAILYVTGNRKFSVRCHARFKMGKDTQGNKPLINYSTAQQVTRLKLPRPAKTLILSLTINLINSTAGEKRGQNIGEGFLLDLK